MVKLCFGLNCSCILGLLAFEHEGAEFAGENKANGKLYYLYVVHPGQGDD